MNKRKVLIILLMIILFIQVFYIVKDVTYAHINEGSVQEEQNTKIILDRDQKTVYELVNKIRENRGLKKLEYSKKLEEVANIKAKDLLESSHFSHISKKYGETFNIMKEKNIYYKEAGENLAGNLNPQKAVQAWISSQSHRENILNNDYNYTAIGIVKSKKYCKIFVQLFIKK